MAAFTRQLGSVWLGLRRGSRRCGWAAAGCAAGATVGISAAAVSAESWDRNWDRRNVRDGGDGGDGGTAEEGPKQGPARYIVLVRHGQYVHDEERHLSELGRKQAEATGARLAARADLPISRIVYSDVTRAKETFEIIRKQLGPEIPVEESQLLREGAPIPPDPPHSTWLPSASQFFQEGARIEAGFRAFFHRSDPDDDKVEYELLVCHGNVIRYCVLRALQLPPEAWLRLSHANCGITIVRISGSGSVSLEAFGDVGHLPSDMITFN